jgi:hypothetical protein
LLNVSRQGQGEEDGSETPAPPPEEREPIAEALAEQGI